MKLWDSYGKMYEVEQVPGTFDYYRRAGGEGSRMWQSMGDGRVTEVQPSNRDVTLYETDPTANREGDEMTCHDCREHDGREIVRPDHTTHN